MKNHLLFFFFFLYLPFAKGVDLNPDSILQNRNEIFILFKKPDNVGINKLSQLMSIHSFKNDTIKAFLNKMQFDFFKSLNINYKIIDVSSHKKNKLDGNIWSWNKYPTYDEYLQMMDSLSRIKPDICQLIEIGRSVKGKKILSLRFFNKNRLYKYWSHVLLSGGIHGNEPASVVLMLKYAHHLLTSNEDVTLYDMFDLWIVPLSNPDGMYFNPTNVYEATRFNSNGVDLNRNFPDPIYGLHPDNKVFQPENIAIMRLMDSINFIFSINFHCGEEVVNYPWDCMSDTHPDDRWFRYFAIRYSQMLINSESDYFKTIVNPDADSIYGITRGYNWYPIYGGRQDYVCYYKHGREYTIEIDRNLITPEENLSQICSLNEYAIDNLLSEAVGMSYYEGKITVFGNDNSIDNKAKIELVGHDNEASIIYSDSLTGYFRRLLAPGVYQLRISKPGYTSYEVEIEINNWYQSLFCYGIFLYLSNILSNNCNDISIFPNPVVDYLYIKNLNNEQYILKIYNMSGILMYSINNNFQLNKIDLSFLKSGSYIVQVHTHSKKFNNILIKK